MSENIAIWSGLLQRTGTTGSSGKLVSLITGAESDAELRWLCVRLADGCPCVCTHPHCPFQIMANLPRQALALWLETLPRADLEQVFEMELLSRRLAQKCE